jgi:hypothetical protein
MANAERNNRSLCLADAYPEVDKVIKSEFPRRELAATNAPLKPDGFESPNTVLGERNSVPLPLSHSSVHGALKGNCKGSDVRLAGERERREMARARRIAAQRTPSAQPRVRSVAEGDLTMTVAPLKRPKAAEGVLPPLVVGDDGLLAAAVSVDAVTIPAGLRGVVASFFAELGSARLFLPRLVRGLCDCSFPTRCCCPVAHHRIK